MRATRRHCGRRREVGVGCVVERDQLSYRARTAVQKVGHGQRPSASSTRVERDGERPQHVTAVRRPTTPTLTTMPFPHAEIREVAIWSVRLFVSNHRVRTSIVQLPCRGTLSVDKINNGKMPHFNGAGTDCIVDIAAVGHRRCFRD